MTAWSSRSMVPGLSLAAASGAASETNSVRRRAKACMGVSPRIRSDGLRNALAGSLRSPVGDAYHPRYGGPGSSVAGDPTGTGQAHDETPSARFPIHRSDEHTSELQSRE